MLFDEKLWISVLNGRSPTKTARNFQPITGFLLRCQYVVILKNNRKKLRIAILCGIGSVIFGCVCCCFVCLFFTGRKGLANCFRFVTFTFCDSNLRKLAILHKKARFSFRRKYFFPLVVWPWKEHKIGKVTFSFFALAPKRRRKRGFLLV